jgi:hypothetical protein
MTTWIHRSARTRSNSHITTKSAFPVRGSVIHQASAQRTPTFDPQSTKQTTLTGLRTCSGFETSRKCTTRTSWPRS